MNINMEGGFYQGCAKKRGFNPGVFYHGGGFFPTTDYTLPTGIDTTSGCVYFSGDTKACRVKDLSDKMLSLD